MSGTYKGIACTKIAKDFEEGIKSLEIIDFPRQPLGKVIDHHSF